MKSIYYYDALFTNIPNKHLDELSNYVYSSHKSS